MIENPLTSKAYAGNGVTTNFSIPFEYWTADTLRLDLYDSTLDTLTQLSSGYTISGSTVIMTTAPTTGQTLIMRPAQPFTQESDYVEADLLPAETLEGNLDKLTTLTLQVKEMVDRCIKVPLNVGTLDDLATAPGDGYTIASSDGKPVWAAPTSFSSTLATELLSTSVTKGAALVSFATGHKVQELCQTGASLLIPHTAELGETTVGASLTDLEAKPMLSVKDAQFGAVGDGVTDDTTALQSAITYAIANNKRLWFPEGVYLISAPLMIMSWSGTAYSYSGIQIEGERVGRRGNGSTAGLGGAVIQASFNDAPAIIIQNGRTNRIKGLTIAGTNNLMSLWNNTYANDTLIMTESSFNQDSSRDSRYSPSAGICMDPFGTSVPSDGGYADFTAYYVASASGSSDTIIEDCTIYNFIAAICLSPNGTTQNNDVVTIRNCDTSFNKYSVIVGNSQNRGVVIENHQADCNYVFAEAANYSTRLMSAPKIRGAVLTRIKYLARACSTAGDTFEFSNIFAERLASLGYYGQLGSSQCNGVFTDCRFHFSDWVGVGPVADTHLFTFMPIEFRGCSFSTVDNGSAFPLRVYNWQLSVVTFTACSFHEDDLGENPLAPSVGVAGVEFMNVIFNGCGQSERNSRLGRNSWQPLSHFNSAYAFSSGYGDMWPAPLGGSAFMQSVGNTLYFNGSTSAECRVSLGSLAVTLVTSTTTATFTPSDTLITRVGDKIYAEISTTTFEGLLGADTWAPGYICIGLVTSVGTYVTISGVPQSLDAGTYALYKVWMPRYHMASTGTITTGSADITGVTNPTTWKAGHPIKGTGIPAGAYVTTVASSTVTISKPATATTSALRLYDANIRSITNAAV